MAAKTIRYYEEVGLISAVGRGENGYRQFNEANIEELRLVKGARQAGFNIEESKELMGLFQNKTRQSKDVKALTLEKMSQLEEKIQAMNNMLQLLEKLSDSCVGNEKSDCAILDGLTKNSR